MDTDSALLLLHVLSAIVAVGANVTYGVLLARAKQQTASLSFALGTIRFIDSRMVNPAYGLLLITGVAMAMNDQIPMTTPWILAAVILFGVIAVLGMAVYAPVFRRQIRLAETEGAQSEAYQKTARLGNILNLATAVLTVIIVFLMVVKPALWGG